MRARPYLARFAVVLALCLGLGPRPVAADGLVYSTSEEIHADAVAGPCDNKERLDAVVALFKKVGARDGEISVVEYSKDVRNVVLTIPGSEPGFVVIGAHYDKASVGCGAVDNWTGIALLAHTYKTYRQIRPRRTVVFVAFGAEEAGLKGSRAMVKAIAEPDRASYCAVVNLDSFGLGRPQIFENGTTPKLGSFVTTVAEQCKVPIASSPIDGAMADSMPFKEKGIPAVTLHGLSGSWRGVIHTSADTTAQINAASVYLGYILALNLLSRLDGCECGAFR